MFRNQYDTDVTTFSPAGRLFQLEYACEAVKQGSACAGLRSKTSVVLVANKHQSSDELAGCQEKLFKVADHMAISVSGLVADARVLTRWMINETLNHDWAFETPMNTGRLVAQLSDKSQVYTQKSEKRPYGVGLLVAGIDRTGPHLYQTDPSGDYLQYEACAMGARSQSARTYLEKHFETFPDCTDDELIKHGMLAIKSTAVDTLTTKNISVCVVKKGEPVRFIKDDELRPFVDAVKDEEVEEGEGDDDDEKME